MLTIRSCYQLNALAHIAEFKLNNIRNVAITNYLDDFLKIALLELICNHMITNFHKLCDYLGVPIVKDKTSWADIRVVFLGILLDGLNKILAIPEVKRIKATSMLESMIQSKRTTVKNIQGLAGLLNFLNRAIYPGRVFTRRMYAKGQLKTKNLKPFHHINLDVEFKQDCRLWLKFLEESEMTKANSNGLYRPFIDLLGSIDSVDIGFYTDSSANPKLGFGGVIGPDEWVYGQWKYDFIHLVKLSIEYLELYAVLIGIYLWVEQVQNTRFIIHCNNMSVVGMINKTTSGCQHCMHLPQLLVLKSLQFNFRLYATQVSSQENVLSDSLSCLQLKRFYKFGGDTRNRYPRQLPHELWPTSKIWNKHRDPSYLI